MNSQKTSSEIITMSLSIWYHHFGSIAGNLMGYSEILSSIAYDKEAISSWNNLDKLKVISLAKAYQSSGKLNFKSLIDDIASNLAECKTIENSILEKAQKAYQDDFLSYYHILDELESEYLRTEQLDGDLLQQLTYHAEQLMAFRQYLGDLREAYWREANEE